MNLQAIRAIYLFEMYRLRRNLSQSLIAPVLSTSLYFVVFGSAIGSRMQDIDGVNYGAFIVPGLIMLSVLTQSISNASFSIYFPRFTGTIYELLSAPVSYLEILAGYVGAAASKSLLLALIKLRKSLKKMLLMLILRKLSKAFALPFFDKPIGLIEAGLGDQ